MSEQTLGRNEGSGADARSQGKTGEGATRNEGTRRGRTTNSATNSTKQHDTRSRKAVATLLNRTKDSANQKRRADTTEGHDRQVCAKLVFLRFFDTALTLPTMSCHDAICDTTSQTGDRVGCRSPVYDKRRFIDS